MHHLFWTLDLPAPAGRLEQAALWSHRLMLIVIGVSLFGFATFMQNSDMLGWHEALPVIFDWATRRLAQAQMLLAVLAAGLGLIAWTGWRWWPALPIGALTGLGFELSGTMTGLPFGPYAYTELLGWKILDHVPLLIPLSWFTMAIAVFGLARVAAPGDGRGDRLWRILTGAALLTAWDLTLDPAMSGFTSYWVWAEPGSYYGMPLLNLFGWFVTGLTILALFEQVDLHQRIAGLPARFALQIYLLNLALPLGMCLIIGAWLALGLSLAVLGVIAALGWARRRSYSAALKV